MSSKKPASIDATGQRHRAQRRTRKLCDCGKCKGKHFYGTANQKYHPACRNEALRAQRMEYNRKHPEIIQAAMKRYENTPKCIALREEQRTSPYYRSFGEFGYMKREGRVHEMIVITAAWRSHYGEPLSIHDRLVLQRDENSPAKSHAKEIDIYNEKYKTGIDVQSFWAFSPIDPERNRRRKKQDEERRRLATKNGINLIEIPFGLHQVNGDVEHQDRISKVINILAEANPDCPPSGEVGQLHAIEGVLMAEELIIADHEVSMPIFPLDISQSRRSAVAHPNKCVYVKSGKNLEEDKSFLQYSYVFIVYDLAPYKCMENVEKLKENPEVFITTEEREHMFEIRKDIKHIFTPEDLPIVLFSEDKKATAPAGFIVRNVPIRHSRHDISSKKKARKTKKR